MHIGRSRINITAQLICDVEIDALEACICLFLHRLALGMAPGQIHGDGGIPGSVGGRRADP